MAELPPADWTQRADLAELVGILGAEHIRWVGGCVRDTLLGTAAYDIDAATTHLPDEIMQRCEAAGIRTVPTGIDHGTITAVLENGSVEVTTVRHDVATDGRRATVAYATDWREDAARRDFTINALYAHPETLEISDYFDGLADLDARRVRFIGDARQRIAEDHLRILRYFRFRARFGVWDSEETDDAESACAELAATLKGLSRERIAGELLTLLALDMPLPALEAMTRLGVLGQILPETTRQNLSTLARLHEAETSFAAEPDALRRLAALLPPSPEVAGAVAARLRLSNQQRNRLTCLAERHDTDANAPERLAYENGVECARDRLLLNEADPAKLAKWSRPEFPLRGRDVLARGIEAGPQISRILREVEHAWIAAGFADGKIEMLLDRAISASRES